MERWYKFSSYPFSIPSDIRTVLCRRKQVVIKYDYNVFVCLIVIHQILFEGFKYLIRRASKGPWNALTPHKEHNGYLKGYQVCYTQSWLME